MFVVLAQCCTIELSVLLFALLVLVIFIETTLNLHSDSTPRPGGAVVLRQLLDEFVGVDMIPAVSLRT